MRAGWRFKGGRGFHGRLVDKAIDGHGRAYDISLRNFVNNEIS
nr:hypothetical protein RVX_1620 [Nitratidesulfovibrio sp. HK-II]